MSVVIPAYNEASSIASTLEAVIGHLTRRFMAWEVIVVDDGSQDATAEIVSRVSAPDPRVRQIRNGRNRGKGASVREGMLSAQGDYIFFMDADLSVPIDEIDAALDVMRQRDVPILIGSRRVKGASIETHQPALREYLGRGFTYMARLILSVRIVDFTCGFKGFRREDARLLFSMQRCDDWAFDAEILYLARLLGRPVYQHPVRWRHHGDSKVRLSRDIWHTLTSLMRIRLSARRQVRARALDQVVST